MAGPASHIRAMASGSATSLIILIGLGAILFAVGLNTHEIGRDEAVSVLVSRRPLGLMLALLASHEPNPAGYFLMLHWWPKDTVLEARLLSYFPAIAVPPLVYLAARRLETSALTAGLLAAAAPFLAYYADEVRMYSWLVLFGAAALVLIALILGSQGRVPLRLGIVLGALLAVGMYLHYFAAFTGLAVVVALLWFGQSRAALVASATAAILFVPGGLMLRRQAVVLLQSNAGGWQQRTDAHAIQVTLSSLFAGSPDFPPAVIVTLVFVVVTALALRRLGSPTVRLLLVFVSIGIVLPLVLGTFTRFLTPRYLAASLPALLLLTSAGLATLRPRLAWTIAGLLILASTGLSVSALARYDGQKLLIREGLAQASAAGALPAIRGRIFAPPAAFYADGKVAYAFTPPPVDYIGLYALPPGAQYPPRDGQPILFFDYCNQTPPQLAGYVFRGRTVYAGSFCLDLEAVEP